MIRVDGHGRGTKKKAEEEEEEESLFKANARRERGAESKMYVCI